MKWIEKCLSSVFNSSIPNKVIVIDNGSTDGTINFLEALGKKIIFYKTDQNLGFGKANNIGLKYAIDNNYDYVYLLNQDAWVFPDTFEILIKELSTNPELALISPLQLTASLNSLDKNFLQLACPLEILSDALCAHIKPFYHSNFIMAAHWLLKTEIIKQIGGFSPAFPHYGEDDNYIQRLFFNNYKIGISTEARAIHDREERIRSKAFEYYYNYIYSIILIENPLLKHRFLKSLKHYIKIIIFHFSIPNFKYFMKFFCNLFYYKKIFKQSLQKKAFL
ncbi:MAG: glycosyltransferase [Muribaculaceae bacterium]|nr:glycosyltransferase [Muribaculaceae bacterium]